jgi:hypothetical protein
MADYGCVAILFGKFDGVQSFSERANLVDLNQNRISDAFSDPFAKELTLVTNRSSPTSWIFAPRAAVSFFQPTQSFSEQPSSIEMIGYFEQSS